jgi:hypothetical protein
MEKENIAGVSLRGVEACLAWLQLQAEQLHSGNPAGAGSEWSWSCVLRVFG